MSFLRKKKTRTQQDAQYGKEVKNDGKTSVEPKDEKDGAAGKNKDNNDDAHGAEISLELDKNLGIGKSETAKDLDQGKLNQKVQGNELTSLVGKLIPAKEVINKEIGNAKMKSVSVGQKIVKENEQGDKTNEEEPDEEGDNQGNRSGETDQNIVGHLVVVVNRKGFGNGKRRIWNEI